MELRLLENEIWSFIQCCLILQYPIHYLPIFHRSHCPIPHRFHCSLFHQTHCQPAPLHHALCLQQLAPLCCSLAKFIIIAERQNEAMNTPQRSQNDMQSIAGSARMQNSRLYPRPSPYLEENLFKFAKGPSKTLLPIINDLQCRDSAAKLTAHEFFSNSYGIGRPADTSNAMKDQSAQNETSDRQPVFCYCCMQQITVKNSASVFCDNLGGQINSLSQQGTEMRDETEQKSSNYPREQQLLLFRNEVARILPPSQSEADRAEISYQSREVVQVNQSNTLMNYFKRNGSNGIETNPNKDKEGQKEEGWESRMKCLECGKMICLECARVCGKCRGIVCRFDLKEGEGAAGHEC